MSALLLSRARRAAVSAALAKTEAAIDTTFGTPGIVARDKQMARTAIRALSGGLHDTAYDAFARRYRDLADVLPADLPRALQEVETRLVHERLMHQRYAAGAWFLRPSRTRLSTLTEARLILRWLRRHAARAVYAQAFNQITMPAWARLTAAE